MLSRLERLHPEELTPWGRDEGSLRRLNGEILRAMNRKTPSE